MSYIKKIWCAHRNYYCIQMLLSGKPEVASPERLSGHNQSCFRTLEYDRTPAPDSIFYSELHRYVVICTLYLKKCKGLTKSYFIFLLKLNDHPTRSFSFGLNRIHLNGCMFELNFKKFKSKTESF